MGSLHTFLKTATNHLAKHISKSQSRTTASSKDQIAIAVILQSQHNGLRTITTKALRRRIWVWVTSNETSGCWWRWRLLSTPEKTNGPADDGGGMMGRGPRIGGGGF